MGKHKGVKGDPQEEFLRIYSRLPKASSTEERHYGPSRKDRRSTPRKVRRQSVQLIDEDGVSGFVVSPDFDDMTMFDRQTLIDKLLRQAPITPKERRHIL